jgi:hypothetical protein
MPSPTRAPEADRADAELYDVEDTPDIPVPTART